MEGKINNEVTMIINGRVVRPDILVDFGDRGSIAINLKRIPGTNKNSPLVCELELFDVINTFLRKTYEKPICSFNFFEKDSQVFVTYEGSKNCIGFTGYEAIVCKRCFSNPSTPVSGDTLYDDFVDSRKGKNINNMFVDEYRQQVRSATERVNKKLKAFFDIEDDILTYSSIPQVTVNSKFLK